MEIYPSAHEQLTPQYNIKSGGILNPSETLWLSLITCKNEEDSIKNKGSRAVATLFTDFADEQGQLTP